MLIDGAHLCEATHPNTPNLTKSSRGRKAHLTVDGQRSKCRMTVSRLYPADDLAWATVHNGPCRTCFTATQIHAHWYHPKECPGIWEVRP